MTNPPLSQPPEGLVEDDVGDAVLTDVDLGEEGEVQQLPSSVVEFGVELPAMLQEAQRCLHALPTDLVIGASRLQQPLGVTLFRSQGVLPQLQVGHRDGVSQAGVEQFLALPLQLLEAAALRVEQLGVLLPSVLEFLGDD